MQQQLLAVAGTTQDLRQGKGRKPLSSNEVALSRTLQCRAVLCSAGKTHLGLRLAQLYGLLHVNTATILAELQHMDPDTQKVRQGVAGVAVGVLRFTQV